jgi:hypothetical protein
MTHIFTLPNGRQCGARVYAKAWRTLKAMHPDTLINFGHHAERVDDILAAMRGMLSDVINRHDRTYGVGRKWDNDYQIAMWRDSPRLRDLAQRIRVYQFESREARSRFSHLLTAGRS